eukprot:10382759-Lingulodinium_polyedra.AAC.1
MKQFLLRARARSISAAVVYVDVVSAFYSVVRQLAMDLPATGHGVARLRSRLGLSPASHRRL